MIYVASPYSSPLVGPQAKAAEEARYRKVLDFVNFIIQTRGPPAFSPIVYGHTLTVASSGGHGTDAQYWHKFNMAFLRKAEAVFVLMLPGWENSKGVKMELEIAKVLNIPVVYYNEDFSEAVQQ